MNDILNANLLDSNNLDNSNEINYSDVGKKVKAEIPSKPLGIPDLVIGENKLMPTVDLADYKRYTSSDAFPKIGIDPNLSQQELERQYDANQSYGEAFGNTMGKLWNTTSNSFMDFFRADFSTHDALIKHAYQELKEEKDYDLYHPNFDARTDETKKSFLQWIPGFSGSLDNYEQFAPNLGYTIGMVTAGAAQNLITGGLLGGLSTLAGTAEKAYEGKKLYNIITGLDNFKTGANALKTLGEGNTLIKGLQMGLEGYNMWSAFQSEASVEGANTGQSTYDYLVNEYSKQNGLMPVGEDLEKIQKMAYKAAETDYWMNAPILLASNFIQFSRALMPTGAKVISEATEDAMKGYVLEGKLGSATIQAEKTFSEMWKTASSADRFKIAANAVQGSLKPVTGMLTEGMEESLQRFSSTFSQDYYVTEAKKGKGDLWESTKYSFLDMISKEGLQEFIGGAIIGMGTSLVGKVSDATGLSDKFAEVTGTETKAQAEERKSKYRASVLDLVNKSAIDLALKDEGVADLFRNNLLSKDVVKYNNDNNLFEANNAKHLGLYNLVWSAVHSGKDDFIIDAFDRYGDTADIKQMAALLKIDENSINKDNLKEITNSIVSKIKETRESFRSVEDHFASNGRRKYLEGVHNEQVQNAFDYDKQLRNKYSIDSIDDLENHWDKFSKEEQEEYNMKLMRVELSALDIHAYDEGVKVAAISYQSLKDSKNIVEKLVGELNNNKAGLNYSEAVSLMDSLEISNLRKQVQTSLSLATEPQDKKKYERQLEILKEARDENRKKQPDAVKIAQLMHDYAVASRYEYDALNKTTERALFESTSNFRQKLQDIVRHQNRSKSNLDIFNYLQPRDHFEKYTAYIYAKLEDFFNQVYEYKEQMQSFDEEEMKKLFTEQHQKAETKVNEGPSNEGPSDEEEKPKENKEGRNYLDSNEVKEKIAEIQKKENLENYNIRIYKDENDKHFVEAEYKSSLYGELENSKKEEIESKFKSYLDELDKAEETKKEVAKNKEIAEAVIKKYRDKIDSLANTTLTKTDKQQLRSDFINESVAIPSEGTMEYDKELLEISEIIDNLQTIDDEADDFQEGNTYVPEEIIDAQSTQDDKDLAEGKTSVTVLKTSARESNDIVENGVKIGEKLKTDPYSNFIRRFKNYLQASGLVDNFVSPQFSKEDGATFRLVIKTETAEDQIEVYGKEFNFKGQVLVIQTLENGNWVDAYFDEAFNLSTVKKEGFQKVHISFSKNFNANEIKNLALDRVRLGLNKSQKEAEIFINLQLAQNQALREASLIEPQEVYMIGVTTGIHITKDSRQGTLASKLVKDPATAKIQIAQGKKIGAVTEKFVKLNGRTVFSGSAHVLIGTEYIRIKPTEIPENIIKQLDQIMNHKYDFVPGMGVPKEAIAMMKYLSTFVYTAKGYRTFSFNEVSQKIQLQVKTKGATLHYDSLTQYNETTKNDPNRAPLYLNISKSQLESPVKYVVENGKVVEKKMTKEEYTKFILDNSYVYGDFELVNDVPVPIYVNSYISFEPAVEEIQYDQAKINQAKKSLSTLSEKELKTDGDEYVNKKDKDEKFHRVSILKGKFNGKGDAADRGTIIDSLLRDFILGKFSSFEDFKDAYNKHELKSKVGNFSEPFLQELFGIFNGISRYFNEQGIELLTNVPTLWGQLDGTKFNAPKGNYAGTVDILGIKPDGSVIIIDLKTSSQDRTDKGNAFYQKYKKDDTIQQSAYAELLRQRTGIHVDSVYVLPIQVTTDRTTGEYIDATPNLSSTGDFRMEVEIDEDLFPKVPKTPTSDNDLANGGFNPKADPNDGNDPDPFSPLLSLRNNEVVDDLIGSLMEDKPSAELEFVKKIAGKAGLRVLFEAANSEYWGKFTTAAVVLTEGAKQGTGYHEAWHTFSQMFLTKDQKDKLYREARRKVPSLEKATPIEIEEFLADDFKKFMLTGESDIFKTKKEKEKSVFQKILDFIKQLFSLSEFNIEKVYNDLRIGDLYDYKSSVENAYWGKLNSVKGLEEVKLDRLIGYSKHVDGMIGIVMNTPIIVPGRSVPLVIANNFTVKSALENPNVRKLIETEIYKNLQQIAETAQKSVREDLNYVLNNWKEFLKFNSEYSKNSYSLLEDEIKDDEENETDESTKDQVYDRAANEESSFAMGSDIIKQAILTVPKCIWKDGTWKVVRDRNNLLQPGNPVVLWNMLVTQLNDNLVQDKFYELLSPTITIDDKGTTIPNPEYIKLVRKIPELGYIVENLLPKQITFQNQLAFKQAFYNSFCKPYVPIVTLVYDPRNNQFFERIETKNNRKLIQTRTYINFQGFSPRSKFFTRGIIQNVNGKNYLTGAFPDYVKNLDLTKLDKKLEFLELLGFNIPRFIAVEEKAAFDALTDPLITIAKSLALRATVGNQLSNPLIDVKKTASWKNATTDKEETIEGEGTSVEKILDFVSENTLEDPSASHRSAGGKMKYGIQQYNRITRTNYWLSKTNSYEEILDSLRQYQNFTFMDVDNYSISRGSLFMEQMFGKTVNDQITNHPRKVDAENQPITVIIESYDGINEKDSEGSSLKQEEVYKLNERDKLIMDFNSFLKTGRINMLQNSSKRTYYSMRLSSMKHYISIDEVNESPNAYNMLKFKEVWKNYLEAELFKVGTEKYAKMNADKFSFFDFLNKNLKEKLKKEAKEVKDGNFMKVIENNYIAISAEMEKYFADRKKELAIKFADLELTNDNISKDLIEKYDIDTLMDAFVMNHYIIAMEEMKLFRADPQFYSDFYKRTGQDVSTGTHAVVDNVFLDFIESKRDYSFGSVFDKTKTRDELSQASFITIQDQIETSLPITQSNNQKGLNITGKDIASSKIVADAAYSLHLSLMNILGQSDAFSKEMLDKLEKELGGYKEVNVTDGGGYCTLDFYRRVMLAVNNWGEEKEALYLALSIQYRLDNNFYKTEKEKDDAKKELELYKNKAKGTVFNIAKFQVNAMTIVNGVEVPILHKFSLAPLFPEQIKDTELEKTHTQLLKTGADYIPFKSSSKSYTPNITDLIKDGNFIADNITEEDQTKMQLSDVKEQILTASKFKSGKSLGVQVVQLAFSNLFKNGVPIDYNGSVADFLAAEYKDLSPIGKSFRDYVNSIKEIRTENRLKLYQELGIKEEHGKLKVTDVKKLIEKLHQLADSRGANINVKDYIQYDEKTKDFANPIDFALNVDEIKKLVNGLIDRKLRKMRVNGSMSVQMSDFGQKKTTDITYYEREKIGKQEILVKKVKNHDYRNATAEEKLKYGANGLPFYYLKKDKNGKVVTSKMGVKVTLSGDYKNLLNLKDVQDLVEQGNEPLKALNMLLMSDKWREEHEDVLTIVGYRIPTQGPNSMDIMMIHEFLPEYMGNTIILPAGITTKSGADYDIDKLSLFFKHITKEGKVVTKLNASQKQIYVEKLAEARKKLKLVKNKIEEIIAVQKENSKVKDELEEALIHNQKILDSGLAATDQVEETEEQLEELLDQQADLIMQYENELKDQEDTHKELTTSYKEVLNEVSIYVKMLDKNAQFQNGLMDSFESILTNPAMFYHMIKPNSTATLEALSIEIGKKLGRETKKFEGSDVIKYLSSLNKHDELQEGKQLLGGWATSNKFLQNLIIANVKLRTSYKVANAGGKERTVYVRNPLLTVDEERKMLDSEGHYELGGIFSATGDKFAQDIFSEAINMTVDIEAKPFARTLGLNKHNAQVAIYLTLKKVPQDRIWYFLNQPILIDLYKDINVTADLRRSLSNILKKYYNLDIKPKGVRAFLQAIVNKAEYNGHDIKLDIDSLKANLGNREAVQTKVSAGEFYDLLQVERTATPEEIKKAYRTISKEVHPDKNQGTEESEEAFKKLNEAYETLSDPDKRKAYDVKTEPKRINPGAKEYFEENGDMASTKQQMLILAYFSTAGLEAKELQDMRKSSAFDSTKINGVLEAGVYLDAISGIKNYSKIIVNPEDYYKHSLSMLWDELNLITSVNKKIFPIASDGFVSALFAERRYKPYKKGFTSVDKIKAERIILNDLMAALIQNFGLVEITEQDENTGKMNLPADSFVIVEGKKGIWLVNSYDADKDVYNLVDAVTLKQITAKREQLISVNRHSLANTYIDDIVISDDSYIQTMYNRIKELRINYPDLEEEFPVIKRLLSDISKDGQISSIELYRADANETSDKNSYISQFNKLVNYESENTEKSAEVRSLFKDLMMVGFLQSGYNMSHLYFTDISSLDVLLPKILSANNVFSKLYKANPELAQDIIVQIAEKIRYNNPRIYTYETDPITGVITEPFNRNYWRFKDYTLNINKLINDYNARKTAEPIIPTEETDTEVPGLSESNAQPTQQSSVTNKVLEGDIFALPGVPVITTNLGGVHGAGLAQVAKAKGLIKEGEGAFMASDKVVQLPVKLKWSDNMSMNNNMLLLNESLNSLVNVAKAKPNNTYLLPLAGLGHGEGSIEDILPLLIKTVQASPNIKLVLPAENVNLGRQGTVRKDNTRENLPKIKAMLSEAGLLQTQPQAPIQSKTRTVTKQLSYDTLKVGDILVAREKENGDLGTFKVTSIESPGFVRFDVEFPDANVSEKDLGYSESEFNKYFEIVSEEDEDIEDGNPNDADDLDSSNSSTESSNDLDSETPTEPEVKEVPTYEKLVSLLDEQGIITTISKEEFDSLSMKEQQRLIDDTKNCEF